MYKAVSIPVFQGLFTSLDGQAPLGASFFMLNAAVGTGIIKFRPGFTPRRTRPANFESCLGFQFVKKFSDSSSVAEVISIEKRGGTIKPYSYWNGSTTEITNGGTALSLENVPHLVTPFYGKAYVIAPGAVKTLYRHDIGTNTSFTALQDSTYVSPDEDASLTASVQSFGTRWTVKPADTITITSTNGITASATSTANGIITVTGTDNDNGSQQRTLTQIDFSVNEDWSSRGYIGVEVNTGTIFSAFEVTNVTPQIKTGGTWRDCEFKEFVTGSSVLIVVRVKGVTGNNAVQGIRFTIGGFVERVGSSTAYTVNPLKLGGQYLEAPLSTDRLWDYTGAGTGINYAARYCQAAGAAPQSAVSQKSITADGAQGAAIATYSTRLGGRTSLSVVAANTGTYTHVEFLRLMEDGTTWKRLAVVANTSGTSPSTIDTYEENELTGLTTVTLSGVDPVPPAPVFRTTGLKDGCRYKGFMCWVFAGASSNICYSRVLSENYPNAAEELYSPSISYGTQTSQPATFTLSEGGDEPVRVLADDDVIYVLGNLGVYVQAGDTPSTMSPIRPVPESSPLAGLKACCIFPPSESRSGLAWLDNQGRVWFTSASRRYNDVLTSEPIELTKGIRGFIRKYLLDEQRSEYGLSDFSTAILSYSDHDDSLRLAMGNREVVYRPHHLHTGKRFWEHHQYTLRHVTPSVVTITSDWRSTGVSAASVSPGDVAWLGASDALESDDTYATAGSLGYGTSRTTETLRFEGFTPDNVIPLGSTITNFEFRVERSKTGDLAATETTVQPRLSGASSGTNRSTSYALTSTDTTQIFVPSVLPTVAQLNSGAIGLDLRYTQETWLAAWNDPANWTITISPSSPNSYDYTTAITASHTTAYTVTFTWIGGGTAPTQVWASFAGSTSLSSVANSSGTGTTSNGLGGSASGAVYALPATPEIPDNTASLSTSTSTNERITLVAGVGTKTVTMTSTATVAVAKMRATHTLSAGIYAPTPATVRVDEVVARVSYQAPVAGDPGPTSIQGTTTIDKGGFLWVRSSGEVDEIGYDSQSNRVIEGTLRDGGKAAPDGKFELGEFVFPSMSRLNYVSTVTGTYRESVTVQATSNRLSAWQDSVNYGTQHRFGVNLHGQKLNIRFLFTESLDSLSSADIEFVRLSTQRNK